MTQTKTYLGAFAYSIKTEGNIIKHVKINKTLNNKFQLDQPDENGTGVAKQFDNLEELVDHYKEFGMVDTATSLIRPDTPGQFFWGHGLFFFKYPRTKSGRSRTRNKQNLELSDQMFWKNVSRIKIFHDIFINCRGL